jgi:type II secretory pathway pseudopilin PulG
MEMLIALGIVAALAALLLPTLGATRQKADRIAASANMRQIGLALHMCAGDRDGLLPGPLQVGQKAGYTENNSKQLVSVLAPYLDGGDLTQPTPFKVFLAPAFLRAMKSRDLARTHPFVMNISPTVDGGKIQPFGSDAPGKAAEPMKLPAVPANVWALADADQKNPLVTGHPWAGETPGDIIHGRERLALHLDGSVQSISTAALQMAAPPPKPPKPPPPPKP